MRTTSAWLIVLGALSGFACGDDQHQSSTEPKDATTSTNDSATAKDLPAPDAAFAADREGDKNQPGPDTSDSPVLDVAPGDRPPADVMADSTRADLTKPPTPLDTASEAATKDASAFDAAPDSTTVTSFPCRSDLDCCIVIDACLATAYLYSRGTGGAGPPTLPTHNPGDPCLACIPPAVQVSCVSGQCTGEKLSTYSSQLTIGHCGTIALPDGGSYALYETIDGGSPVPAKSTWSCGS